MMAVFMGYTIAITLLAAFSGHLIEKCCISLMKPARGVWLAGIVLAVFGPVAVVATSYLTSHNPSEAPTSVVSVAAEVVGPRAENIYSTGTILLAQAAASLRPLDSALGWLWVATSLGLAASLALFARRARQVVRSASRSTIGGTSVLLTDDVGPAIVGTFRYEILLPRWVVALPTDQKELIVAHEHQHARVFDPLLLWLAAVTIVLFPWNGGLWYIMRRLRTSIEFDCDRRVLKSAPDAHAYMTLLVDMVERVSLPPAFAAALTESPSQLQRRILAMTTPSRRLSRIRTLSLALGACALLAAAARMPSPASPLHQRRAVAPEAGSRVAHSTPQPKPASSLEFTNAQDTITRAYWEYEVSQPVTQVPGTAKVIYPPSLRAAKVQGEVLAEFVVDVEGKVELKTVAIKQSPNDLFSAAVTAALREMRFDAAKLRGTKVRQVVQQAFLFRLDAEAPPD